MSEIQAMSGTQSFRVAQSANDIDSGTVLQYHLRNKTIHHKVIVQALKLDRTTVRKWSIGELYPHRPNATKLIEVFGDYGIELDYNDIYREYCEVEKAS